ncbi:hypothetical protein VTI28DRAFT_2957 [Corynascus sepedonium]
MHAFLDPASPESPDFNSSQSSHSRRIRPPDPNADAAEAVRIPLRADLGDKSRKRESRLGLRNIFGRARGGSDADSGPPPTRDGSHRLGGIRASLAEISWPHVSQTSQGHRSDISLSPFKGSPVAHSLKHKKSESVVRQLPTPDGIAAWNPPPLFKAYPQAIKHAHLPACTLPAEVVLRMHAHKSSVSLAGLLSPRLLDAPEDTTGEKPRVRHRRNGSGSSSRFEWTSKVYVLTTSGYLLQYAGEGTYDRLPERVLQLGKDSAAFASDAIPGRHWVIQVTSSVPEPDRVPGTPSSLRARLPFRGHERKHSSVLLMVCESAEEMEGWIATLRREIETLGGRKILSETGKPKSHDNDSQLRSQASQRTLVMRDPDRFSRVMTPDQSWNQTLPIMNPSPEENAREQYFDDNSTASFISHEGRQLDTLRDSCNRLSFVSSGQRTMVTSVGSSPACSPIRDSFGDFDSTPELREYQEPQPRLRPNAKAIIDRRQSLQTINHVLEMGVASAQSLRPLSTCSISGQPDAGAPPAPTPQPMPDFGSAPGVGKRFSFARTPGNVPPSQATASPLLARMSSRRPPPSALSINPRPLSLVEDQPSPALSAVSRAGTATDGTGSPLPATPLAPPVTLPSPHRLESEVNKRVRDESIRDSGISTQENTSDHRPQNDGSNRYSKDLGGFPSPRLQFLEARDIPRSSTSLGTYGDLRPIIPVAGKPEARTRRRSFNSSQQIEKSLLLSPPPSIRAEVAQRPRTPSLKPVPRSAQHLRPDPQPHLVPQRRSMSQLGVEGPPLAPPPNRALPPIPPQKPRMNGPPPGFI